MMTVSNSRFGFACSDAEALDWASGSVSRMSLEEQIGQLLAPRAMSHYVGADDPTHRALFEQVVRFHVGGFVFFQGEVFGQAILADELQQAARIPLLFSQDAEWGVGMRLFDATTFPNMMGIGASGMSELAYAVGRATAEESKALGVRFVFAPVADLNNNPENPIINVRSFGEDPFAVADLVRALTRGLQDGGVLASVKHFPGHGDTATDSHAALPVLNVDKERLQRVELVPFRAAIDEGVASVMVGHLAIPAIDPSGMPATLSRPIVTGMLRDQLGYRGLLVSDAMEMNGVQQLFDPDEAAVRAVDAGLDLLLTPPDVEAAFVGIRDAVRSGRLTADRIADSARRVLAAKALVGLTTRPDPEINKVRSTVSTAAHRQTALEIARKTIVVDGPESLPINRDELPFFLTLSDSGEETSVGVRLRDHVRLESSGPLHHAFVAAEPCRERIESVLDRTQRHETIVAAAYVSVRSYSGRIGLPEVHSSLLNELARQGKRIVLLCMGSPYVVMSLAERPECTLFAFGSSESVQTAVAEVLLGEQKATASLPITIPGFAPRRDAGSEA